MAQQSQQNMSHIHTAPAQRSGLLRRPCQNPFRTTAEPLRQRQVRRAHAVKGRRQLTQQFRLRPVLPQQQSQPPRFLGKRHQKMDAAHITVAQPPRPTGRRQYQIRRPRLIAHGATSFASVILPPYSQKYTEQNAKKNCFF